MSKHIYAANFYSTCQWRTQEFSTGGAYQAFHALVPSAPRATWPNLLSRF